MRQTRSYLPFNFIIVKTGIAIRLAEDGKEWAADSLNYPLTWLLLKY